MLNTCGTIAPAQERAEPYRSCAGPVQVLCRACTRTVQALYGSCTGPVRVPVQIPYITHIMAAQVWHRHRTRTVRALRYQNGTLRSQNQPEISEWYPECHTEISERYPQISEGYFMKLPRMEGDISFLHEWSKNV